MKLLTLVIALMTFISTAAASTSVLASKDVNIPALTKRAAMSPFNGASACQYDWKPGEGGGCECWNDGYGIDRSFLVTAITRACRYLSTYSFSDKPNNETGLPTGAYFLDYHNIQDPEDEGVILVSMGYYGWADGQASECAAKMPIKWTFDLCWNAMHAPFDDCNTSGENGKQGGWALHECMVIGVDPNPRKNEPHVWLPLAWDPVVLTY